MLLTLDTRYIQQNVMGHKHEYTHETMLDHVDKNACFFVRFCLRVDECAHGNGNRARKRMREGEKEREREATACHFIPFLVCYSIPVLECDAI